MGRQVSKSEISINREAEEVVAEFCRNFRKQLENADLNNPQAVQLLDQRSASLHDVMVHNTGFDLHDADNAKAWLTIVNGVLEILSMQIAANNNNGELPIDDQGRFIDPITSDPDNCDVHHDIGHLLLELIQDANYVIYVGNRGKVREQDKE